MIEKLLLIALTLISCVAFSQQNKNCSEIFGSPIKLQSCAIGYIYSFKITSDLISFDYNPEDILDTIYTYTLHATCKNFNGFESLPDKNRWFAINYIGTFYIDKPGQYTIEMVSKLYALLIIDSDTICKWDKVQHSKLALQPGYGFGLSRPKYLDKGIHTINATYVHTAHSDVNFSISFSTPNSDTGKKFDIRDFQPYEFRQTELGIALNFKDGVLFESNSAELNPFGTEVLNGIYANFISSKDSLAIVIEGHTDDIGDTAYNKKLSLKRAQRVAEYLKTDYADTHKIWTLGHGEEKPTVPNYSDANRAKNRRVEILIMDIEKVQEYLQETKQH